MAFRFFIVGQEATAAGFFADEVRAGPEIVLGRSEDAHIVLLDPSVSRRHCRVTGHADGLRVEDLGSRLGTRLNGAALSPGEAVPLRAGDELSLGVYRVIYVGDAGAAPDETRAVALALQEFLEQSDAIVEEAFLEIENGPEVGRRIELPEEGVLRLGRGRECEIRLDDARTSRTHAVIRLRRKEAWLEDAGSQNGTFVGERRVRGAVRLADRDRLRLGRMVLRLRLPKQPLDLGAVLAARTGPARRLWLSSLAFLLLGVGGLLLAAWT
ncbi:MAG: FHA domain-containing protein [Myxococcales bacterium]|nr:FHA domain-containing protein [Myxococcales bacterium]